MKTYPAFVVVILLTLSSCTLPKMINLAEDQSIVVSPNPMVVVQNKLNFVVDIKAPKAMIKKGTTYSIHLFLKWEDQELGLEPITQWTRDSVTQNLSFNEKIQYSLSTGVCQCAAGDAIHRTKRNKKSNWSEAGCGSG